MPVSWETPPNVLFSMLHTETVPLSWAFGLRNLQIPGRLPPFPVSGMPYDHARNTACQAALEMGADYVFFLDSDVIPPHDVIWRLLKHKAPIVSGLYNRRMPPWAIPVAQKPLGQWWVDDAAVAKGLTVEVDVVGAGCLLLSRDFLENMRARFPLNPAMGRIWFEWKSDRPVLKDPKTGMDLPPEQQHEKSSEDFSMCMAARRNGYKVLLDTSIRCRHVGLGSSTYKEYYPDQVQVYT